MVAPMARLPGPAIVPPFNISPVPAGAVAALPKVRVFPLLMVMVLSLRRAKMDVLLEIVCGAAAIFTTEALVEPANVSVRV